MPPVSRGRLFYPEPRTVATGTRRGGYRPNITFLNVKFSTNEGMGAIGRGEGMAALAVATLDRMG